MKKYEREKIIMDALYIKKRLELEDAINLLKVSESTVRRILNNLEEAGKVVRTHGGVTLINNSSLDYSFDLLMETRSDEKFRIGEYASFEIADGDTIYLDCGTTVLSLCIKLSHLLKEGKLKNVLFFTNSLANLEVLSPYAQVNLIGGHYRPNRKDFAGYITELTLGKLYFKKCFCGVDGINVPSSFNATDFDTAKLNQIVTARSEKVYVLCDSSKFGKYSLISYAAAGDIDVIITDSEADEQITGIFETSGVQVVRV